MYKRQVYSLGEGSVGVLLGNGDGTFQPVVAYGSAGVGAFSIAVADVNADGKPDIVVANFGSGTVGVLLNNTRVPLSQTVVVTSGSPTLVGQPVTFTATVTSAQGTIPDGELVTFYDGITKLGSVALAAETAVYTTSALSGKTHTIKATYVGDAMFKSSTGRVKQVVNKESTTTTLSSSSNPSVYGQAVTFAATVTSAGPSTPTGTVRFKDGTLGIGSATLSGGVATLTKSTLAVGTHTITAQYVGDAETAQSTSAVLNQVVQ